MSFSENINFLNIFSSQTAFSEHLADETDFQIECGFKKIRKYDRGRVSQFLYTYNSRLCKSTKNHLDHLSAESAEITRRAALKESSRRVLSHHICVQCVITHSTDTVKQSIHLPFILEYCFLWQETVGDQ